MGDKRPDQHNIDPGEAGSSDYKRVNPAARELRERKSAPRNQEGGQTADERVDEASEESFPASDPPAQP